MEVFGWHCADTFLGRTTGSGRRVNEFVVAAIGADSRGSAVVWFRLKPWFYVDLRGTTAAAVKHVLNQKNVYPETKLVEKVPLNDNPWGEARDHLRLAFTGQREMGYAASLLRRDYSLCEADIPPVTRVFHAGIPSCGWIEQPEQRPDVSLTNASWETSVKGTGCLAACPDAGGSLIVTATWDVEVFSAYSTPDDQRFPSADNEGDMVIQIVTFFSRSGEQAPYKAHATVVGVGDPGEFEARMRKSLPPSTLVVAEVWATEKELLEGWVRAMAREKALVWQHFNGLGFDEGYVFRRCKKADVDMDPLSIIKGVAPSLVASQMESNAYGHNEFETIEVPGVFHLDLMVSIKKDFKLASYSLNACGEHFLKERKVDMSPQRLFDTFRANTSEGHMEILEYCVQDVWLTWRLGHQLNFLTNLKEMASATMVPINFLITRGQQVKVQSLICNLTTKRGMVMRTWPKDHVHGEGKYKGATVLDPLRGAYFRPILTLDFASLYPSIMRAHNMSHDTLVREGADIPEGVEIDWVDIPVGDSDRTKRVGFVQSPKGVCPELLESLALNRKAAKKEMAKHEKLAHEAVDPAQKTHHKFMEAVFNAKQLAFKVSMNSVYGFLGVANGGKQPCIDISAAVTTFGRIYLERAATGALQRAPEMTGHPVKVVYGDTDSIMVDAFKHLEPLDTKEKREEAVRKAFELGEWLAEHLTKLYKAPNNLEFEKVYMPFLLYEKKRYAGQMYSADLGPEKAKKVDYKGIQVVRTDTIGFVKRAISGVVNTIMTDMSTLKATKMARDSAVELLSGSLDYGEFVMSKKLNSSYKVVCTWADPGFAGGEQKTTILVAPSGIWRPQKGSVLETLIGSGTGSHGKKLRCEVAPGRDWAVLDYDDRRVGTARMTHPHVHVALRKELRCPGSGEKAGDRVRYVFRSPERGEGGLQMETAEDPDYLTESGGSLDLSHYFENTFRSPMESLFELFYDNPFKVLFQDVGKRLAELQRQKLNKRKGQSELSQFFSAKGSKK